MRLPRQYVSFLIIMFPLVAAVDEAAALGQHYIVSPESTSASRLPPSSPSVMYVPLEHPPFALTLEYQEGAHVLAFTAKLQADNIQHYSCSFLVGNPGKEDVFTSAEPSDVDSTRLWYFEIDRGLAQYSRVYVNYNTGVFSTVFWDFELGPLIECCFERLPEPATKQGTESADPVWRLTAGASLASN